MASSSKPVVIAISGPTASGKTTLAQALVERFAPLTHVKLISQDNFYLPDAVLEDVGEFKNWDVPSAIDFDAIEKDIIAAVAEARNKSSVAVILLEGLLLPSAPSLHPYFTAQVILDIPIDAFKERRFKRDDWLRENPTYFDLAVLPAHHAHGNTPVLQHCKALRANAELPMEELHNLVFEAVEAWRNEHASDASHGS